MTDAGTAAVAAGRDFIRDIIQADLAAASTGIKPIEQRGPRPANVKEARGRRSKAGDDGLGHEG